MSTLAEMAAGMRKSADQPNKSSVLVPSCVLQSGLNMGKRDANRFFLSDNLSARSSSLSRAKSGDFGVIATAFSPEELAQSCV